MGKGYQSTQGKFLDFIADPNFDMHMKLADQQVKEHYAKSSLLNAAPDIQVDYWDDAHGELVANKKQAYQDRIEKITKSIYDSEDLSNINKFMPELKSLKRELTQDFTKGDLHNVQKTAENHRKFQEELSKLKDPGRRQAYIKAYQDSYLGGEKKEAFEYNPLMDSRNIDAEFLKSNFFSKLPERIRSGVTHDPITGGMMLKKSSTITQKEKERIEQAYKQFVNSDTTIKSYAQESQNVLGEQGWFNENDELDFSEQGRLGQGMRNIGDMMSYRNVTRYDENYVDDPFNLTREAAIAGAKSKANPGGIFTGSHLEGEWTLDTAPGRELIKKKAKADFELIKHLSDDAWAVTFESYKHQPVMQEQMIDRRKKKILGMTVEVDGKKQPHPAAIKLQELEDNYQAAIDFGIKRYEGFFKTPAESKAFHQAIKSGDFARGMMSEKGTAQMSKRSGDLVPLENLNDLVGTVYNRPGSVNNGKRILKIEPTKTDNFFPGNRDFTEATFEGGVGRFRLIFEGEETSSEKGDYPLNGEDSPQGGKAKNEEIIEYYAPKLDLKPYIRFN